MTKAEIIEIVKDKTDNGGFCPAGGSEALKWLGSFPAEATEAEIIAALDNPEWACRWAFSIGTHRDELAEVVLKARDAGYAYKWARDVGTHRDEMAEVVLKAGGPDYAYLWAEYIGTHKTEMQEVIDSKKGGRK